MKPGLAPGDLVISQDVDAESIRIGDIVRYSGAHGDVIHRVVDIEQTPDGLLFTTKGDNNNVEDAPFLESRVKGKVVFDAPYIGWVPIKIKELLAQ